MLVTKQHKHKKYVTSIEDNQVFVFSITGITRQWPMNMQSFYAIWHNKGMKQDISNMAWHLLSCRWNLRTLIQTLLSLLGYFQIVLRNLNEWTMKQFSVHHKIKNESKLIYCKRTQQIIYKCTCVAARTSSFDGFSLKMSLSLSPL